jgi:tetratricopeptide (TPR) repeat protein
LAQPGRLVQAWKEDVTIPTYVVPPADLNPMFLEKRVYQGSSGKVYPNPFTDRLSEQKVDRLYEAIFLENEYIKLMILPEIGGRIHMGLDKTNQYHFFYHQQSIKPALVGLLGPWISGGVEFNWPQHHRPSTFMPVDWLLEEHSSGARTVWLSEHEPMNRMKGMVGIRLNPESSVVEAHVRIYNRTPFVQTFLWWANAGVHVHEEYQAFFPPDVTYVADHAKRAVSSFPIARNYYYGVDYSPGVDIRWYRNIPVPTSYMVTESRYNFFGGYDHRRQAGLVHVADRHIAPGKKLWTWGSHEFGKAWDRELTDTDGPYIELMAGVYTDNQPDFSWLHPYETRTFRQFWYPIQQIGLVKNACERLALNLEVEDGRILAGVCATQPIEGARIVLQSPIHRLIDKRVSLSPGHPWLMTIERPPKLASGELNFAVFDDQGRQIISYQPEDNCDKRLGHPATEPPLPSEIVSTDKLYFTGLHLEQYRHATRDPAAYWQVALQRDPDDSRNHQALGSLALRRGNFTEAEKHFRLSLARQTQWNPNPLDGESSYSLGLALSYQGRTGEAYAAFAKAGWNYAWKAASLFSMAQIECRRQNFMATLQLTADCLQADPQNSRARTLRAAALRKAGKNCEARALAEESLRHDPLDFGLRHEMMLALRACGEDGNAECQQREMARLMGGRAQTYLDIAFDYSAAGLFAEAIEVLNGAISVLQDNGAVHPMLHYSLGYFYQQIGNAELMQTHIVKGAESSPDYCFPSRLEELVVLQAALRANPADGHAHYYLGNLLYDKKRYSEAITHWEQASQLKPSFSIPWRNLGVACFNVLHDAERAADCYERAMAAKPGDARLLYERDQLAKRMGVPPQVRLKLLSRQIKVVEQRDDLVIELVALYNQLGRAADALQSLMQRRFHPWEGGEGLVSAQYVWSHFILGRKALHAGDAAQALTHFEAARHYPDNLGEGKHLLTPEHHLHYYCGLAREALRDVPGARQCFAAATQSAAPLSPMNYYRALALAKMGESKAGREVLEKLLCSAQAQLDAKVSIDYFATSLPNFLLFTDDLEKRNRIDCHFLIGLARLGLGEKSKAIETLRTVVELDPYHLAALEEINWIQ